MGRWRLVAAAAASVMSVPLPVAAEAAPPAAATARRAEPVPCPTAQPPRTIRRPPRPKPPAADPALRKVGGAGLDTPGLAAPAGAGRLPRITATSWIVADLDTGAVVGACGPHEYAPPASVQKLLLAATLLPKLDPRQIVKVTRADLQFEPGSSAVGLLTGGSYSVEILWLGLLLNSGNDAANVLARLGGGRAGVAGTLRAMNAEARRLGAFQTNAVTPSGLDGRGQFTSAYDLALIARACFANEDFRRYARTERAKIPAQPPRDKRGFQIQNDNQLLFQYPGAIGGKTGFTNLARHTYVGAAARGDRRLVVTLLGGEALPLRGWQQGARLLDWGFQQPREASVGTLIGPDEAQRISSSGAAGAGAPAGAPPAPGGAEARAGDPISATGGTRFWVAAVAVLVVLMATALVASDAVRRRRRRAEARWR